MSLHVLGPLSQNIVIDDRRDIARIYGIEVAGELLRTLGVPTPPGQWFRIVKVDNGVATIETKYDDKA